MLCVCEIGLVSRLYVSFMQNHAKLLTHTHTHTHTLQGSSKVHSVLLVCGDSLIEGGKLDIFTPMFRILARKPVDAK